MERKILALMLVALIGIIVAMALIFRYEYHGPSVRIDRFTGAVEFFCHGNSWAIESSLCPERLTGRKLLTPQIKPTSGSHEKCINQVQLAERLLQRGYACSDIGTPQFACSNDKNRDGVIQPWEKYWSLKDNSAKCGPNSYLLQDGD